jgi:hypothetical protein
MDEVSSKPRAAAQSPEFQKRESRHEERPCEDDLIAASLEELWQQDPDGTFDLCLHSLSRTAAMMEEIVEETRADLETIEARRIAIDRTQAETRAILNEVMERMK